MPRRPSWLLLWKAWGGASLWRSVLITTLAWFLVPQRPIAVPGRAGVQSVLWPLVPTLFAIVLPSCLSQAYRDLELTAAKRHASQRLVFAFLVLGSATIASAGGLRFDFVVALRNTAMLVGLALLSTVILSPRLAWLPPSLLPMVTWLFGLQPGGVARPWAVLMHSRPSVPAAMAAVGGLIAGLSLFIALRLPPWDVRGDPLT